MADQPDAGDTGGDVTFYYELKARGDVAPLSEMIKGYEDQGYRLITVVPDLDAGRPVGFYVFFSAKGDQGQQALRRLHSQDYDENRSATGARLSYRLGLSRLRESLKHGPSVGSSVVCTT